MRQQPEAARLCEPTEPGTVAVHAHFHRPDHRNPWTGRSDLDPSDLAPPGEQAVRDCYRANAAARRTDQAGAIVDIVDNYRSIGWDASPSLLDWLADVSPWTRRRMIEADAAAVARTGHGAALAHPYVHAVLPLASAADRTTLVRWGIGHFRHTFGRQPEGMWLPENAADQATLATLVDEGVAMTVLTAWQATAVRRSATGPWTRPTRRDLRRAHRFVLDDGRSVTCWFHDAVYSEAVAFGGALLDGWSLGTAMAADVAPGDVLGLVVDGETFGLHHPRGEMALAAAVGAVGAAPGARCCSYSQLLGSAGAAATGGRPEVRLRQPSARSCRHGVERWRDDCGDTVDGNPTWNQRWRRPLRNAVEWLSQQAGDLLDDAGRHLFDDPWAARDAYIDVLVDPRSTTRQRFLRAHGARPVSGVRALSLLEIQRHALAALDSDAWFGADPADAAPIAALRHADRAVSLASAVFGVGWAPSLRVRLAPMRGNRLDLATADELWDHYIAPARTDSSAVARAEALRRIVGAPGVSNHRWQVRAMGARRVVAGPSRTCAARYVVTDQATGARASHLLVALDDGSGRLQGAELTDAAGDLSVVAARAARRGLMAVADAVAATFELVDLAPDDRSEILAAHVDVLSQRGMSGLDIEAGIAMIGQLTDLGLDVPPALAGTVAGSLANRLRALLDRPVVDETAAIRLLGHGATVAWVSDGELAGVIDAVIDRSVRGLGGVPPPAAALRRLAVLARLAARSGPPAPSIWWVQNAVVGWRSALAPSTRPEVRSALGELAVAIDVAWPDALPLRNRFPST